MDLIPCLLNLSSLVSVLSAFPQIKDWQKQDPRIPTALLPLMIAELIKLLMVERNNLDITLESVL